MSNLEITFHLKAYHPYYLNRFIVQIRKKMSPYISFEGSQVFLPTKVSRFTVLRSPHVDKKSREQFERKTHKRLLKVTLPLVKTENMFSVYSFIHKMSTLAVGVHVRLTYNVKPSNSN